MCLVKVVSLHIHYFTFIDIEFCLLFYCLHTQSVFIRLNVDERHLSQPLCAPVIGSREKEVFLGFQFLQFYCIYIKQGRAIEPLKCLFLSTEYERSLR